MIVKHDDLNCRDCTTFYISRGMHTYFLEFIMKHQLYVYPLQIFPLLSTLWWELQLHRLGLQLAMVILPCSAALLCTVTHEAVSTSCKFRLESPRRPPSQEICSSPDQKEDFCYQLQAKMVEMECVCCRMRSMWGKHYCTLLSLRILS